MASGPSNPGDINSIHPFLAQLRARHRPALDDLSPWVTDPSPHPTPDAYAYPYPPRHRPASSGKATSRHSFSAASSSTEHTRVTSVFSADAASAPHAWLPGAADDAPDRRELNDHELLALHEQAAPPAALALASRRMPCEFARYTGCIEVFDAFSEAEAWMSHILTAHLDWVPPVACLCWFCDDFKFEVGSAGGGADRVENFRARMVHIAGHFQEGTGDARSVRPDFYFLDHVWERRLIGREVFEREKGLHEVVQVEGLRPRGYRTAKAAREEERRACFVVETGREEKRRRREGRRPRDKG